MMSREDRVNVENLVTNLYRSLEEVTIPRFLVLCTLLVVNIVLSVLILIFK